MEPTDTRPVITETSVKSAEIPPEEEELFREFQAYTRSIYIAATDGAVQSLISTTAQLKLEVDQLNNVVVQSRENYQQLFEPAILEFKSSAELTLISMSHRQEELSKLQEQRIAEALQKLAQEHQEVTKQNADAMTTLVKSQAKQLLWVLAGMGLLLVAILILLIIRTAR